MPRSLGHTTLPLRYLIRVYSADSAAFPVRFAGCSLRELCKLVGTEVAVAQLFGVVQQVEQRGRAQLTCLRVLT